ncbi:MAG: hypothetical protein ABFR63_01665 [Thermodesulfobacteriota bacterium]
MTDFKQEITAHWSLINRIAGRRFADDTLAEEGALYVLNRLEENNYRRLHSFSGRSKLSTFISALTIRLLEDFSRRKFGRVRPPSWITALGGIWVSLFQLLCLQRLAVSDAVETMLSGKPGRDAEQIEETAWTILERVVNCGQHQGFEVPLEDDEQMEHSPERQNRPEDQVLEREQKIFFQLLFSATDKEIGPLWEGAFATHLRQSIQLNAEERLLLKLCFQDELSVTRAGEMLGLNANQAHGKLRRLLTRLRDNFDKAGISEELRGILHE